MATSIVPHLPTHISSGVRCTHHHDQTQNRKNSSTPRGQKRKKNKTKNKKSIFFFKSSLWKWRVGGRCLFYKIFFFFESQSHRTHQPFSLISSLCSFAVWDRDSDRWLRRLSQRSHFWVPQEPTASLDSVTCPHVFILPPYTSPSVPAIQRSSVSFSLSTVNDL